MDVFRFYHPANPMHEWRGKLPHREQEGICYFVTFMTRDAMPLDAQKKWEQYRRVWLHRHGLSADLTRAEILAVLPMEKRNSFERILSAAYQRVLDGGSGECVLSSPSLRQHVVEALRYHSGRSCHLADFVVMPNHVHALLQPFEGERLKKILGSIRSYSARQINQALGRSGAFWAKEPFDHMVRSRQHFKRYGQYIRANPKRAKLREGMYTLGSGSEIQ